MRKSFYFIAIFSLFAFFTGCEVGMGQALDLEAPVITVTSPETLSNVHKQFTITGTCSDNIAVTAVEISDKQTGEIYAKAIINGSNWTANLNISEGEKTLVCTAKDAAGNGSTKSSKTMIYLVDETAPEGLSWYVDRGNNVQTPLMDLEKLENLDYDDFTNIDVPQNQSFKIYGRFYDAMSIKTITLKLYEGTTLVSEKSVSATTIAAGSSIYSPCFEFSASDMSLCTGTGKHYLKLQYESEDDHGNITNGERGELNYMLWWPDSDEPRIEYKGLKNGMLRVNIGSAIPIHFFDDDLLEEVRYALVDSVGTEEAVKNNPSSVTWSVTTTGIANQLKRDLGVQIDAPNMPAQKKLVGYAKDDHGRARARIVDVEITDASIPLIFIESPEENSIPDIKTGTTSSFEIKGYSLDTTGCQTIKIAYVPVLTGSAAETVAKELLNGTASATGGQFVQTGTLGEKTTTTEGDWKKQTFTFTFDLLNDFKNGTTSYAKEDKFFEILLIDEDNNKVWRQFVVKGDKTAPTISITSPSTDMSVYDYVNGEANLEIKFNASKTTGLGVDADKYKVIADWNDDTKVEYYKNHGLTIESGYAVVRIPKSEIATKREINPQPKIIFEAYDVLGNKAEERRNVVLSPLPQLQKILSGNMNGTYKKGDKIQFQAVFSDAVKVAGTPKLTLQYSTTDTNPKYADYSGTGNRTDTLVFEFTVPEDAECDKLICDSANPIVLSTGGAITEISIKTAATGEGNAYLTTLTAANTLDGKEFKLDGKLPQIDSITVTPENTDASNGGVALNTDGSYYVKANDVIKAVVKFTEKVNISGSPVLHLYGGSAGSTQIDFALQSIENDEITFTHKVVRGTTAATSTPEGTLKYNFATAFTKATTGTNAGYVTTITDEAGNPLKLAKTNNGDKNLVIDTTAPTAAPVINIAGGTDKKYNAAQTLSLTGEEGATIEFSHNGGVSWYLYEDEVSLTATGFTAKKAGDDAVTAEAVTVSGGEYFLKTRQIDKAGNVSPESAETHFTINNTFPSVISLVVSKADGKYAGGETVKFVLTYADKVKVPDATSIQLAFTNGSGTNAKTRTVNATPVTAAAGSNKVEFIYTVSSEPGDEDEGTGVTVTGISYSTVAGKKPMDLYGNSPSANITVSATGVYSGAARPGIILDGKPPAITGYSPAIDAVVLNGNVITLTFSEKVERESGLITLRRKSRTDEPWRIPPVLTETEFNSVYNALSDADKEVLMRSKDGAPKVFDKNGQPLGPYRRVTHGLVETKDANGNVTGVTSVPDTNTKFVLDFNIGIKDGYGYLADGTKVTVQELRTVFEKAGYHKQEVEVTDGAVDVTDNVVTIKFPKALADGREWELFIEPGAFRDATGNLFTGLGSITPATNTTAAVLNSTPYSFWSNKVARPWVRVDRYSHGYAAVEPVVTGSGTTAVYNSVEIIKSYGTDAASTTTTNAANTEPSGYARVRIDCETPGSNISYNWDGNITRTADATATTNALWTTTTSVTDKDPTSINANKSYPGYFVVGDGNLYTGRRDFVKAQATKTGFTSSEFGYEGVFKTVVTFYHDNDNQKYLKVEGGTAAGGMPSYCGFPVRDAEEGKGHDKGCYKVSNRTYVWQSYEILSKWQLLPFNTNYTSQYYSCGYGYANHVYKPAYYNGTGGAMTDIADDYTEVTAAKLK